MKVFAAQQSAGKHRVVLSPFHQAAQYLPTELCLAIVSQRVSHFPLGAMGESVGQSFVESAALSHGACLIAGAIDGYCIRFPSLAAWW